jgi:microcystin-dependent protein
MSDKVGWNYKILLPLIGNHILLYFRSYISVIYFGSYISVIYFGRFVLSSGQGSGLTNRTLGQTGGAETITLSNSQIPNHTHSLSSSNAPITSVSTVNNNSLQTFGQDVVSNNKYALFYSYPNTATPTWFTVSTTSTISGRTDDISNYTTQSSVPIMSPYYALAFIIRYQ